MMVIKIKLPNQEFDQAGSEKMPAILPNREKARTPQARAAYSVPNPVAEPEAFYAHNWATEDGGRIYSGGIPVVEKLKKSEDYLIKKMENPGNAAYRPELLIQLYAIKRAQEIFEWGGSRLGGSTQSTVSEQQQDFLDELVESAFSGKEPLRKRIEGRVDPLSVPGYEKIDYAQLRKLLKSMAN